MRTVQELDVSGGKVASVSVPNNTTRVLITCNQAATLGVHVAINEQDLGNNQRFLIHPNRYLNLTPYVGSNQLFFKSLDGVSPDQLVYVMLS